jgi:hypothetical protein
MDRRHRSSLVIALSLAALWPTGCSCESEVGGNLEAGPPGADAAARAPTDRTDECGNGMDDDLDGSIDEGCFCGNGESQSCYSDTLATNLVGRCARGTQACRVEGSVEWGTWDDCEGDVTPGEESCEGTDEDCDGAVDEGCPCTEGDARPCDVAEFVSPPCIGGEQTCTEEGRWSGCEGAVRPEPERCDNGIDDDCDGTIDDPSFCECTPMPELCGNGVDDDCDGAVDEPDACSTTCVPVPEVCGDGIDQDCDGADLECPLPDGGVPTCTDWTTGGGLTDSCPMTWTSLRPAAETFYTRAHFIVFDGELMFLEGERRPTYEVIGIDIASGVQRVLRRGTTLSGTAGLAANGRYVFMTENRIGADPSSPGYVPETIIGTPRRPGDSELRIEVRTPIAEMAATCEHLYAVERQGFEDRLVRFRLSDGSREVLATTNSVGDIRTSYDRAYVALDTDLVQFDHSGAMTVLTHLWPSASVLRTFVLENDEVWWFDGWNLMVFDLRTRARRLVYTTPEADRLEWAHARGVFPRSGYVYFQRLSLERCIPGNTPARVQTVRVPMGGGAGTVVESWGRSDRTYRHLHAAGPSCFYANRAPACASGDRPDIYTGELDVRSY